MTRRTPEFRHGRRQRQKRSKRRARARGIIQRQYNSTLALHNRVKHLRESSESRLREERRDRLDNVRVPLVGGPLDGEYRSVPQRMRTLQVPVVPRASFPLARYPGEYMDAVDQQVEIAIYDRVPYAVCEYGVTHQWCQFEYRESH